MAGNDFKINIAIDGPAGAGKSTVARHVANALGYVYVDTGAMYRVITLQIIRAGLDLEQKDKIIELAIKTKIQLVPGPDRQFVYANGEDVTDEIRTTPVNQKVSWVSQIKQIRELLSARQKEMAMQKGIVMDGRDIGTHVLPDAEVKIFMTASVEKRAERRYKEMLEKNDRVSLDQLKHEIAQRDRMDEQRELSPLTRADDAIMLDSSTMTVQEVVEQILKIVRTKMDGAK